MPIADNIRDTIGKRSLCSWCRGIASAQKDLDLDEAVVDADVVQSLDGLRGVVGLVEDNCGASQATAGGSILHKNLLRLANIDSGDKVLLHGN